MKIKTLYLFLLFAITAPTLVFGDDNDDYKLVWSDEFNGSSLNKTDWTVEQQPSRWMNEEIQAYTESAGGKNTVEVKDGYLNINCFKSGDTTYSGRIYAKKSSGWEYGYIEARMKLPKGVGTWPAFWMMPVEGGTWPGCGEIDIMEEVGFAPGWIHSTIHCTKYNNGGTANESGCKYTTSESDYHVYAMKWSPSEMIFYIDNEAIFTYKNDGSGTNAWPFDKPYYIILNLAWGGTWGGEPWAHNGQQYVDESALPLTMSVDYVRVYQIGGSGESLTTTDTKTQLGDYGSLALDGSNKSTFDFNKGNDYVVLDASSGVKSSMGGKIKADYSVDWSKYLKTVWNGYDFKYYSSGVNSFGEETGWNDYVVKDGVTWSGVAYTSSEGNGKDLSMIDDDYYLHFSMRGTDADAHHSHAIWIGNAKFAIGNADFVDAGANTSYPVIGDYKRDGRWCSFDIPVSKLKSVAGSDLFTTDGGASAFAGNAFVMLSGGTAGTEVQFDNIFFYKRSDNTSLGDYGSKSLDANGASTFDYSKGTDYVIIDAGTTSKSKMNGHVKADYSVGTGDNILNNWAGSYTENTSTGVNSIGASESYRDFSVNGLSWGSGLGFTSTTGKDLSMLDDSYYLHFAIKGNDFSAHTSHQVGVGGALFTLGTASVDNTPVIGDFKRDGEWYSFDIPFSAFSSQVSPVFETTNGGVSAYNQNAVYFKSGATADTKLQFDNVFFYKKATAQPLTLSSTTSDGVAVLGGAWNAETFATIDAASKAVAYDFTAVTGLPSNASLSAADPNALFIVPSSGTFAKNEVVKNADGSGYTGTNIMFSESDDDNAATHDACTAISPITVTNAFMSRTFSATGVYFTTVVPFDVATLSQGVTAYELTSSTTNGSTILLFNQVSSLKAGKPYLMYTTYSTVLFYATGGTAVDFTINPVEFSGAEFAGTYKSITDTTADQGYYIFKKNATTPIIYNSVGGNIPAFRSYFQFGSSFNAKGLRMMFSDATGIREVSVGEMGKIVNAYSIDGKLIQGGVSADAPLSLPKGMYIVNGRKVIVK